MDIKSLCQQHCVITLNTPKTIYSNPAKAQPRAQPFSLAQAISCSCTLAPSLCNNHAKDNIACHSFPTSSYTQRRPTASSPTAAPSLCSARLASPLTCYSYTLNETSTQHTLLPTNLPTITLQLTDTQQPTTHLVHGHLAPAPSC